MHYLIEILLAYVLADAASGVVHASIDRGIGPKWLVEAFRWHHMHPESLVVDFYSATLGVPLGLIALLNWYPAFWVALGAFTSTTQIFHWCAHRAPAATRVLQRVRLVLTPKHHGEHHQNFQRNFCIVSGWNNWWLNYVLRAFRAKELETTLVAIRAISDSRISTLGTRLAKTEHQLEQAEHSLLLSSAEKWKERALTAERVIAAVREALEDDPQQSLDNLRDEIHATEKSIRTYRRSGPE